MMKILVIGIDGLDPQYLIGEKSVAEQLVNFHRIMEVGCFGRLDTGGLGLDQGDYFRNLAVWENQQIILPSYEKNERDFIDLTEATEEIQTHLIQSVDQIVAALSKENWTLLEYVDTGLIHLQSISGDWDESADVSQLGSPALEDYYLLLNEQLGRIFENIDQELVFSIISRYGLHKDEPGYFILTSPNMPLDGEMLGVSTINLYATLFDLAGYGDRIFLEGKSFVTGLKDRTASEELIETEEDILRERLSGLGYL